jgi:ribosomal protein S18 acetylase RimI-like enzyme
MNQDRSSELERESSIKIEKLDFDSLTSSDLVQLALLHNKSLPDSLASRMGVKYLRVFYRFLSKSPCEFVFVVRDATQPRLGISSASVPIVAAVVVSLSPATIQSRMLRDFRCLIALLLSFWRFPIFKSVAGSLSRSKNVVGTQFQDLKNHPELIIIFSDSSHQSRGIGRRLIEACDVELRSRDFFLYTVRTLAAPSNRAIGFYERNGFSLVTTLLDKGREFVFLKKSLKSDHHCG